MADPVRAIADAVLYEGYLLWPYRRSATKNQRRWTFGGVHPPAHTAEHPDDRCVMRAECLVEGAEAVVEVSVRFLHVVRRDVGRAGPDGGLEWVDELEAGGRRHLAWDEAVEREIDAPPLPLDALAAGHDVAIAVAAGSEEEDLYDAPAMGRGGRRRAP